MGPKRADDGAQFSIIQFGTARRGPQFGLRGGCVKDRLSSPVQSFFGMEPIKDLDGARKQFLGCVPDPERTIAQRRASGRFGEASQCCFSQHSLGEVRSCGTGIRYGGAFDGGRISDRSGIRTGLPSSSRDSAVHTVTSLASRVLAELSGCLPARPATSEGRIGTPVPSISRYMVGATSPILSTQARSSAAISVPSASAARCTWLTLTSTPVNSCSKALLSSKLASAAVPAIMRRTPGVSEKNSSRRARSRGQNPARHWAQ